MSITDSKLATPANDYDHRQETLLVSAYLNASQTKIKDSTLASWL